MRALVSSDRAALIATSMAIQVLVDLLFHHLRLNGSQQLFALRQRQPDILQASGLPF